MTLGDLVRATLEQKGEFIGEGTEDCKQWKQKHFVCAGCPYELGCRKLSDLMMMTLREAKAENINAIFEAKSVNELAQVEQSIGGWPWDNQGGYYNHT